MTQPPGRVPYDEAPPQITVEPILQTAAGVPVALVATIVNISPEPRVVAVAAMGVDAAWLPPPVRTAVLLPGASVEVSILLRPSFGTLPARYPLALTAQAIDPASETAMSNPGLADVTLVVDAPGQIEVDITPAEVTVRLRKRISVRVRNRGSGPEDVRLDVQSSGSATIRLAADEIAVPAGATTIVRGRIKVKPRVFGDRYRLPYTVSARASAAPQRADGAVVSRAVLGSGGPKAAALVVIVAVWVALAITLVPKLSSTIQSRQNDVANVQNNEQNKLKARASASLAQRKASASASLAKARASAAGATSTPGSSGPSASPGSGSTQASTSKGSAGSTGSSKSAAGSTGAAGSKPSSSKPSSSKSSAKPKGSSAPAAAAAGTNAVQLSGTVVGTAAKGVTVTMRPTSLVEDEAQNAKPIGVQSQSSAPIGKVWGGSVLVSTPTSQPQNRSTKTTTDGAWSFARVRAPGYYLVTFAKPGYQTQRYVIDSSAAVAANPLSVDLLPGDGRLSGIVSSAAGVVGDSKITISDGTNTISTSTNSRGSIGHWSVTGLSTPSTYLVSASKDGLSTESVLVTLAAGATLTANLKLLSAATSLTGTVRGPDSLGAIVGLGGVQVTVRHGAVVRTATTITNGNLAGLYRIPDLPPGTYTVTMQAAGYLTQTQRVTIKPGQGSATVNSVLTSATATVYGTVTGVQFDANGAVRTEADGKTPLIGPIPGAGITLVSSANTYKVTSGSGGAFRMSGITPGTYVLTASFAGLTPAYVTVTTQAGATTHVPGSSLVLGVTTTTESSTITGFVASASPSGTLACPSTNTTGACLVSFTLVNSDGDPVQTATSTTGKAGETSYQTPAQHGPTGYTLSAPAGLPAGIYHLTIGATGYLPATVDVRVPAGGVAQAPQVTLYPTNTLTGTIDALGHMDIDGPNPNYQVCVYAVPSGEKYVPKPCSFTTPTSSLCETKGISEVGFGLATAKAGSDGNGKTSGQFSYTVGGLCDGSYIVYVETSNPWYVQSVSPLAIPLARGQNYNYDAHVERKGRVVLGLSLLDPATGAITSATSLTGTAECGTGTSGTVDGGSVTVSGVDASNNVSCTVSAKNGALPFSGKISGLSATNDQDTPASVVLTQIVGAVYGHVVSAYNDSASNPVSPVSVTISGIIGYDGTRPEPGSATIVTDHDGCFAISTDGKGATGCALGSTTPVQLPLVSQQVTISTPQANGVEAFNGSVELKPGTFDNVITVIATPIAFGSQTLKARTAAGVVVDFSQAFVTAVPTPTGNGGNQAEGAGTISVVSDSFGQLTWQDSSISAVNLVSPGEYNLSATLAGFGAASATITCGFNGTCSTITGFALIQNSTISGTLIGYLGQATSYPSNPLGNATVTAHRCLATETGNDVCTGTAVTTTTNASGSWSLAIGALDQAQDWQVTISADHYQNSTPERLTVQPGDNHVTTNYLFITQVNFSVGIQTQTGDLLVCADPAVSCATVSLIRLDAPQDRPVQTLADANNRYVFANLNPGYYLVTITGTDLIGVSYAWTVSQAPPVNVQHDFAVTVASNSVVGTVYGPAGQFGSYGPLAKVSIELCRDDPAPAAPNSCLTTFTVAKSVGGKALTTVTGADGSFSLSAMTAGTYSVRVNNGTTAAPHNPSYTIVTLSYSVSVSGGQTASFGFIALNRIVRSVAVSITTTAAGDDISAGQVTLVSATDTSWTLSPSAPVTSNGTSTWTFLGVPAGDWTVTTALPLGHLGSLSKSTCSDGTVSVAVRCTSTASVTVSDASAATVTPSYSLNEFQAAAVVQATPLALDPNVAVPATVELKMATGGSTVYDNLTFPVGSSVNTFWGDASATYTVTAVSGQTKWPAPAPDSSSSATPKATLALKEIGATITVSPTMPVSELTTVTLTAPTGITSPAAITQTKLGADVVFKDIPFGTGWSASAASKTYKTAKPDFTFDVTSVNGPADSFPLTLK